MTSPTFIFLFLISAELMTDATINTKEVQSSRSQNSLSDAENKESWPTRQGQSLWHESTKQKHQFGDIYLDVGSMLTRNLILVMSEKESVAGWEVWGCNLLPAALNPTAHSGCSFLYHHQKGFRLVLCIFFLMSNSYKCKFTDKLHFQKSSCLQAVKIKVK